MIAAVVVTLSVLNSGHTITGGITVPGVEFGGTCTVGDGYKDISPGRSVTITDENGEVVGKGQLGEGVALEIYGCRFPFSVDVPNRKSYSIEVGDRGELTYSFEDMSENSWKVELSLG